MASPHAHAAQREHRAKSARISAVTSIMARGVSMGVSLFSVPIMARYLSPERYGFFLTATTLATWLTLADVGLGNGLTNRIAEAEAVGDRERSGAISRSAFWVVSGIAGALILVFIPLLMVLPVHAVFGLSAKIPVAEARWTIGVVFTVFALSLPLSLVEKTYAGLQQIYVNNAWTAAAGIGALGSLITAVALGAPLPVIVAAVHGPLLLARAASGVVLFKRRRWLRPWPVRIDRAATRSLLGLGGGFLLAQLAAIGLWQTDQIVLSQLFGAASVAPYVITLRVGTLYVSLLLAWLGPLWPACSDAAARGDWEWVKERLRGARRIAMGLTCIVSVVLAMGGRWAISIWAGAKVVPEQGLVVAMAVYLVILVWCHVHGVILNALGRARGQAIYGLSATVVNIVASVILGRWLGVAGVCWATCVAATPVAVLVYWELRRTLGEQSERGATADT